ncbi:hypothetical protein NM688_g8398 [Phlebia brevispora]|uniref:Uncharacterized protein n=1 Tax=Phlebia brevispora TaxID=194682 RepID=A0ACC1RRV2_9APHY|nr:hypothetical protein NM688_g8398 [Phlebia brevispora]
MDSNNTAFIPAAMSVSRTSASIKIALLLLTGVSAHFSLTPPRTAVQKTVTHTAPMKLRPFTTYRTDLVTPYSNPRTLF